MAEVNHPIKCQVTADSPSKSLATQRVALAMPEADALPSRLQAMCPVAAPLYTCLGAQSKGYMCGCSLRAFDFQILLVRVRLLGPSQDACACACDSSLMDPVQDSFEVPKRITTRICCCSFDSAEDY